MKPQAIMLGLVFDPETHYCVRNYLYLESTASKLEISESTHTPPVNVTVAYMDMKKRTGIGVEYQFIECPNLFDKIDIQRLKKNIDSLNYFVF